MSVKNVVKLGVIVNYNDMELLINMFPMSYPHVGEKNPCISQLMLQQALHHWRQTLTLTLQHFSKFKFSLTCKSFTDEMLQYLVRIYELSLVRPLLLVLHVPNCQCKAFLPNLIASKSYPCNNASKLQIPPHFHPTVKHYNKVTFFIYSNNKPLFNKQPLLIDSSWLPNGILFHPLERADSLCD